MDWRRLWADTLISSKCSKLSDAAERLYHRLFLACDDWGRMPAEPHSLLVECLAGPAMKRDDWDMEKIKSALAELAAVESDTPDRQKGVIEIYKIGIGVYLEIRNFVARQPLPHGMHRNKSRFPAPSEGIPYNIAELHHLAPISTNQHQSAPRCTTLHQSAPKPHTTAGQGGALDTDSRPDTDLRSDLRLPDESAPVGAIPPDSDSKKSDSEKQANELYDLWAKRNNSFNRSQAITNILRTMKAPAPQGGPLYPYSDLLRAFNNYSDYCDSKGTEGHFRITCKNFYSMRNKTFLEWIDGPPSQPVIAPKITAEQVKAIFRKYVQLPKPRHPHLDKLLDSLNLTDDLKAFVIMLEQTSAFAEWCDCTEIDLNFKIAKAIKGE